MTRAWLAYEPIMGVNDEGLVYRSGDDGGGMLAGEGELDDRGDGAGVPASDVTR